MGTRNWNISTGLPLSGETPNSPFCIAGIPPNPKVYELEGGPTQRSSKCTNTKLELNVPKRISPIQSDKPYAEKSPKTQNTNDPHSPNLGSSTVVPPTFGNDHTQPIILPPTGKLLSNPQGMIHPLLENKTLKLAAWLMSADECRTRAYQNQLPDLAYTPGQSVQEAVTTQPWKCSLAGVINNKLIHYDGL